MAAYFYTLHGLSIKSELMLPTVPTIEPCKADLSIEFGRAPKSLPEGLFEEGPCYQINQQAFLLTLPNGVHFWIDSANRIVIDNSKGVAEDELPLYLLGSVMGALCHLRGVLPLHTSVVKIGKGNKAVAFVGDSGAGKSTLVAALAKHNYLLHCDELAALDLSMKGEVHCFPGSQSIMLWADSLKLLGMNLTQYRAVREDLEKYYVPPLSEQGTESCQIVGIYDLRDASDLAITSLHGFDALNVISHNTYRKKMVTQIKEGKRNFQQCMAVSKGCPVYLFSRPRGKETFEESIEYFKAHCDEVYP